MFVNIKSEVPFPSFRSEIFSPRYVVNTEPRVNKVTDVRTHCVLKSLTYGRRKST